MPSPKKSKLAKVVLENVRTAIEESGKFYSGKAPDTMFSKKTNKKDRANFPGEFPCT